MIKYKDFTLDYGGAGYYYASFTEDPERGTPFVGRYPSDEKAWEGLKALIDAESCGTCGKHMTDNDHNYGTDDILTCISCFADAQADAEQKELTPEWSAFWDKVAAVRKKRDEINSGIKALYDNNVPQGWNERDEEFTFPNI